MRRKHSPFPLDFEPSTWDFGLHMSKTFTDLVDLMDRLRSPGGFPWDREQTYATLAPMLLEEAYESSPALQKARPGRLDDLRAARAGLRYPVAFSAPVA